MKKALPFILTVFSLFMLTSCAPTYQRLVAYDHIAEMKEGVILVPLASGEEKATRLDRYGLNRRANKIRRKTQKQSKQIIEAFAENFHFCPVYFCLEEDVAPILDDGQTGLLLNGELGYEPQLSIDPAQQTVFLAGIETVWESRGDNDEEVEVIFLMDEWGNGLPHPFPGVAEIGNNFSRGGLKSAVRELDRNLDSFYARRSAYLQRQSNGGRTLRLVP